jgi:hypothetical protein
MVLLDFSVTPLGKGESVSSYVARCLEIVAASAWTTACTPWARQWRANPHVLESRCELTSVATFWSMSRRATIPPWFAGPGGGDPVLAEHLHRARVEVLLAGAAARRPGEATRPRRLQALLRRQLMS